jgi:hypothetical protein
VVAKMNGFKKSGVEVAKDVAITVLITAATLGVPWWRSPSLQVALIDGTTGDILWANTAGTTGDFDDSGLGAMVEQLFEGFPK